MNLKVGDMVSMWLRGRKIYGVVLGFSENESGVKFFDYYHFGGPTPNHDSPFGWNYLDRLNKPLDPTNGYPKDPNEKLVEVICESQSR